MRNGIMRPSVAVLAWLAAVGRVVLWYELPFCRGAAGVGAASADTTRMCAGAERYEREAGGATARRESVLQAQRGQYRLMAAGTGGDVPGGVHKRSLRGTARPAVVVAR